jgi:putative serine protease PepD
MSDRNNYPPQGNYDSWQSEEAAGQRNSAQWSYGSDHQAHRTGPIRMYQQPYGVPPQVSDPSQRPPIVRPTRQRKTSRAGLLVVGTAAVAMAAGAATAVAVVDHSAPNPQVPASAPVGKPSPVASPVPGQQTSVSTPGSVEQVSAKVLPSVVKIQIDSGQSREEGSGIVLSSDGLILTNNHVVAPVADTATDQGPTADGGPYGQLPGGRSGGGVQATVMSSGLIPPTTSRSSASRTSPGWRRSPSVHPRT